jgi:hypothetical protein
LKHATTTAFALAGLGGLNAHGAGFLAAATKCKVVPDLVTATSGQIIVLAEWLQGKDLEASLVNPKLEHNPFAQLAVAFAGDPGVFRPAYPEALKRWWSLPLGEKNPLEGLFDRLFPAQLYVPTREQADFDNIARALNNATASDGREIGVVFNAYNLKTGQAVLFTTRPDSFGPKKNGFSARRPRWMCAAAALAERSWCLARSRRKPWSRRSGCRSTVSITCPSRI